MKKLFWLLILLPGLAWGGHFGSSTSGKEATVTWSYTSTCDSAWMVFGYDGDAGDPDSANMYDSLKLVQCFSGTGKELCGDGLDLDSIGDHVVRMYCFSGDAVVGIRVGKWEQKAVVLTATDVWAEDTGGVALGKFGSEVVNHDEYKATDLSVEIDSIVSALYDRTNDTTFIRILSQYVLKHLYADSVTIDNSNAWDLVGAGSCPTVGEIADGVWGENDTTVVDTSQLGKWLIANIGTGACDGTGGDTLDIMVFDGDSTAVEGVSITIYNLAKTAYLIRNVKTDADGYCQVFLDPGSYPCWVRRLGVILAEWDTVTVPSGGGRDTIWVVAQDPGSPPSGDLTQVKGYIRTMTDDQYNKGWISFAYHDANVMDTSVSPAVYVDPTPITVQVDTGAFTVNLNPTPHLLSVVQDGPDKPNVTYDVIIWAPGQTIFRWYNITIPISAGAVWLEDLID